MWRRRLGLSRPRLDSTVMPSEITQTTPGLAVKIGPVSYKLELLEELRIVHNTFHVSNLKKCLSDESLVIPMKELWLDDKLNFVEEPIEIIDQEVKQLKQSRIPIVKTKASSNAVKGILVNAVMASAGDKELIDSGMLKAMTRKHLSYLMTLKNMMEDMLPLEEPRKENRRVRVPSKNNMNRVDLEYYSYRCDNGTEFKNKEMNQFCKRKGIKREFSVAKILQNGVVERKNRTLIEAARTMLADSKLPTTFWAEAVNTACYVQNRVLVTKPHNKTPYELFLGKARMEIVPGKDYILLPFSKSSQDDGSKPSSDNDNKVDEDPRKDSERIDQERDDNVNSTNNVNASSTNVLIPTNRS
ncbi:putative ribonuclease H-like domain-containing protein [Tanacetum coccineum]